MLTLPENRTCSKAIAKTCNKPIVIGSVWFGATIEKNSVQWNLIENPEIGPQIYYWSELWQIKYCITVTKDISKKDVESIGEPYEKVMNLEDVSTTSYRKTFPNNL